MSAGATTTKLTVSRDLAALAPAFRAAVEAALAECRQNGLDAFVYEAYRSNELQQQYYAIGRTVRPPDDTVTNAPTNQFSWHGYGLAVDVISKSKHWNVKREWYEAVARIFEKHGCSWGGHWKKPDDPHFQWGLCRASPSERARQLLREKGYAAVWEEVDALVVKTAPAAMPTLVAAGGARAATAGAAAQPAAKREATVRTDLNLRSGPSPKDPVIRLLKKDERLEVLTPQGLWFEVRTESGEQGFVHGDYIAVVRIDAATPAPKTFEEKHQSPLTAAAPLRVPAAPPKSRSVAQTWNRFGGLLAPLCAELGIARAQAVAVLLVESGGAGFKNGRLIIRFENHVFYEQWGKNNRAVFDRHFRFDAGARWKGHAYTDGNGPFVPVHTDQDGEWRVFDAACRLNEKAALMSISMGAPQVMGFNHGMIGYASVHEMFDKFSSDIRFHVLALFEFLKKKTTPKGNLIALLKGEDYVGFAKYYNGSGQAETYGRLIREHVEAFPG